MEVILIKDVPNLGLKNDVVTVKNGYGENYLIPQGFAHGFLVLSDEAVFNYKCTDYYAPEYDGGIRWNDPMLDIDWKLEEYGIKDLIVSEKDRNLPLLSEINIEFESD